MQGDATTGFIMLGLLLALYLLPCFIAFGRKHPSGGGIVVINVLLGWTFLGWVIALAWAFSAVPRAER